MDNGLAHEGLELLCSCLWGRSSSVVDVEFRVVMEKVSDQGGIFRNSSLAVHKLRYIVDNKRELLDHMAVVNLWRMF